MGPRVFDALASLRLAVVTMVTLGTACITGTFYEMNHGTPAAQRDVYRTWWFALILATLGANIFCAMMKRYPWKKHHTGFVMAHIGILTLLAGSLLSLHLGLDGNLALYEGETGGRVDFGPAAFGFHVARSEEDARRLLREATGKNNVSFVLDPGGSLRYGLTTKEGRTTTGTVAVGHPVETPWMGMKVVVDRFLEQAAPERTVSPAPVPEKDERRLSA